MNRFTKFSLTCALTLTFNFLSAATWTWTGASNNNWDTKANWNTSSNSSRPQSGDDVVINNATNQPRLSANRSIQSLTIYGGQLDTRSYTLTVDQINILGGSFTNSQSGQTGNINVDEVIVNTNSTFSLNSVGTLILSVRDNITFTNGKIESNMDDLLIINHNATASNASSASYVNGPVRKIGNDDFIFPIGDDQVFAPIGIEDFSNNSNSQYVTASYTRTGLLGNLWGGGILSQNESWSLIRSNSNHSSKVELFYNTNRSGGISDSSDLSIAINFLGFWFPLNVTQNGTSNSGSLLSTSRVSGSFQGFALSSPAGLNPLPIELLDFNAQLNGNGAQINWSTIQETANDYFTVEKSIDGKNWTVLSTVDGAMNSNSVIHYQTIDANLVAGTQYYRLKQTDINGQSSYSSSVFVNYTPVKNTLNIYPNPANQVLHINLSAIESAQVQILNSFGQLVYTQAEASGIITLDISSFETGIYTVVISTEEYRETIKLTKN